MEEKVQSIIQILEARYPESICALHYEKDYELMIAVRLSAQCTDARVNLVTPALFAAYPTLEDMASANISDVENYVRSCGFYKHKARDIVLACQMLLTDYDGKVPGTMEQLLRLPGVGRKTANLLLGDLYQVPGTVESVYALQDMTVEVIADGIHVPPVMLKIVYIPVVLLHESGVLDCSPCQRLPVFWRRHADDSM